MLEIFLDMYRRDFKKGDEVIMSSEGKSKVGVVKEVKGNKVFLESGEVVLDDDDLIRRPLQEGCFCRADNMNGIMKVKSIMRGEKATTALLVAEDGMNVEIDILRLARVRKPKLEKECKCKKEGGMKNDRKDGKIRLELVPMAEIEDIAKLYTIGAEKYADNSWKEIENGFERYRAALLRHMIAYMKGERFDDETGINHITAVAWNAIAMLWFDKQGKGLFEGKCDGWIKPEAANNCECGKGCTCHKETCGGSPSRGERKGCLAIVRAEREDESFLADLEDYDDSDGSFGKMTIAKLGDCILLPVEAENKDVYCKSSIQDVFKCNVVVTQIAERKEEK